MTLGRILICSLIVCELGDLMVNLSMQEEGEYCCEKLWISSDV
jgi:hypothetical protein